MFHCPFVLFDSLTKLFAGLMKDTARYVVSLFKSKSPLFSLFFGNFPTNHHQSEASVVIC